VAGSVHPAPGVIGSSSIEQVAELQFAFPTFTEGVSQAAQMVVNQLGVGPLPHFWTSLGSMPSDLA
jgi:dihydrolipoamide dehydrogenase